MSEKPPHDVPVAPELPLVPEVPEDVVEWESVNAAHEVTPSLESLAIGKATREYEQRKIEAEAAEKEIETSQQLARVKENLGLKTAEDISPTEEEQINPEDDKDVQDVRERIARISQRNANQEVERLSAKGETFTSRSAIDARVEFQQWREFIKRHPEKAEQFKSKISQLRDILERQKEAQKQSSAPESSVDKIADVESEDSKAELAESYEGEAKYAVPATYVPKEKETLEKPTIHLGDESHENIEDVQTRLDQRKKEAGGFEKVDGDESENPDEPYWWQEVLDTIQKKDSTESAGGNPEGLEGEQSNKERIRENAERPNAERHENNERTSENSEVPVETKPKGKAKKESGPGMKLAQSVAENTAYAGLFAGGATLAGLGIGWGVPALSSALGFTPIVEAGGPLWAGLGALPSILVGGAFMVYAARNLYKEWPTLKKELTAAAGRLFRKGSGKK
jgi:hypothetical protein